MILRFGSSLISRGSRAVRPRLFSKIASLRSPATARLFSSNSKPKNNGEQKSQQSKSDSKPEAEKSEGESEKKPAETEPKSADAKKTLEEQLAQNTKIIEEKELKIKDLTDRMYRALADAENARKIAKSDVDNAKQYGIQSFAKSLIEVSDTLGLSLKSVAQEMEKAGDGPLKQLFEGVKMTEAQLQKAFEKNGLTKLEPIGQKLDPKTHEVVFQVEDPKKEPGTVAEVMKPGYLLFGRLIRPAAVGAVKARPKTEAK